MNKVFLEGNLGRDAELRFTKGEKPIAVANLSLATTEKRGGETVPEWHRIVTWGKMAEACGKLYKKGKAVLVEGYLQTRKWEDKDGNARQTTEVVATFCKLLGPAPKADNSPPLDAYDDMPDALKSDEPLTPDVLDPIAA